MSARLASFHPFPQLPFELRRYIYLLALQPRFVHIQEDPPPEDVYEEFREALWSDFTKLEVHLSLSYFSHFWRDRIYTATLPARERWNFRVRRNNRTKQTTLDAFGFTTTRTPALPWVPTRRAPEIPLQCLPSQPELAFDMCRKSRLYSKAPIPPLLHTCVESRQTLVDHGYELSFGTRTAEPQTWFCFRIDVLYIQGSECARNAWDYDLPGIKIMQFLPHDLQRVQHLALNSLDSWGLEAPSNALMLMPHVRELFIVDFNSEVLSELFHAEGPDVLDSSSSAVWECARIDVADGLDMSAFSGYNNSHLLRWRYDHRGDCAGLVEHMAETIRIRLSEVRDKMVEEEMMAPWAIPSVNLVHIGRKQLLDQLYNRRQQLWKDIAMVELAEREYGVPPQDQVPASSWDIYINQYSYVRGW